MYEDIRIPDILNYHVSYYISNSYQIRHERVWPLHMDDRIELYVLLEGDVSFVVESSLYKLSAGDAIVTRPNERHHCILNADSVHRHCCFWFDPVSPFIFGEFMSHEMGKNNLIVPDERSKVRLFEIFSEIEKASGENDSLRQFYLILEMTDIYRKHMSSNINGQELPDMLKIILSDIDMNFKDIRSLEYFREKYYVSSSTLNRMFRTYLDTTPKTYIETRCLAHSRKLLREGKSVLSACMESGFSDCSNYIRLFRRRFDMTPGQYRNLSKIENKNRQSQK